MHYWIPITRNTKCKGSCVNESWQNCLPKEEWDKATEIDSKQWFAMLDSVDRKTQEILNDPLTNTPKIYQRENAPTEDIEKEIKRLKDYLAETDWMVIKCVEEGVSMASMYSNEYLSRVDARTRINKLEAMLNQS